MALPRYIPDYTVDDYRQWEGDWELWSGVPVAMSPSAKKNHQRLCARLHLLLSGLLESQGCSDCEVLFELDWVVSRDTVFRPDLVIVCDDTPSDFLEKTPVFIAEILSDSTRQRDLLYKRDSYAQLGVKYYLTIDPEDGAYTLLLNSEKGFQPADDMQIALHDECQFQLVLPPRNKDSDL